MFKAVGYEVLELKRITYGKLNLDIEEGDFREVSLSEII
jgi:16S rRNA U516 pseudouridylate synthase RsuA-like enzyme